MDKHTKKLLGNELVWLPEQGIGYYPVEEFPYDQDYFDKYQSYVDTGIGMAINHDRVSLVKFYTEQNIVDVGIGSGVFVETFGEKASGFDVNPAGIKWLKDRELYCDVTTEEVDSMCFWDSLEHIKDPTQTLDNIRQYAFISTPIYNDVDHILRSRHFRKDEHCWYWTKKGLILWMKNFGFDFVESNCMEIDAGREDIMSFVFLRSGASKK